MVIFILLTNKVNRSIQSLFLSNVSLCQMSLLSYDGFGAYGCHYWEAFINGVEDCPVNCLSSFSLVKTLFAKSMASLRLFTLINVE